MQLLTPSYPLACRLASTIYQLFLGSDNSSSVFSQMKRMHGIMPYFMLRGILRISNPVAMIRAVLDLFLARPFGSTSLLQKMFTSGLDTEVRDLRADADLVARKIGDDRLTTKVRQYVDAPKDEQDAFRLDASAENIDLMTVILRSPSAPRVDARTMQYLARCAVRYDEYKRWRSTLADPDDDEGPDNDEAWLYEDLHVYRRLITKARDKEQLIELIFEVRAPSPSPRRAPVCDAALTLLLSSSAGQHVRGPQGHRHDLLRATGKGVQGRQHRRLAL